MNQTISRALVISLILAATAFGQTRPTSRPASWAKYDLDPSLPTLWIIGDSTVRNGSWDDGRNGQWGWGHPIKAFFDTKRINVENMALGGTSSRSYQTIGLWAEVLDHMKPGDYLIMQFGHNDGGSTRPSARGSLAGNGEETGAMNSQGDVEHTFGWYLRKYVSDAKAKGAACEIICSLIPRNHWKDGKMIRTENFTEWAKEAADQAGVPFINLNEMISLKYDAQGEDAVTTKYFPDKETTHTDWAGSILNAQTVVEGIKAIKDCDLSKYLVDPAPTDFPLPSGRAR